MERKIVKTADGSTTIYLPDLDEHYHSRHGALQEAYHVFIRMGLDKVVADKGNQPISILEIGFGTGLNALITLLEAAERNLNISYKGIEAFPVTEEELRAMNYTDTMEQQQAGDYFLGLHALPWEEKGAVTSFFSLHKRQLGFKDIADVATADLIYFDAFGPRVQPELWTEEIFAKMFTSLKPGGVLVTYSAKGSVRRAMQAVGFAVERLPGPPGKREMLRARKEV